VTPVDTGSEGLSQYRTTTLQEVFDRYDVVSARVDDKKMGDSAYLVVAERPILLANKPNIDTPSALRELGYTSMSPWTSWTRDENVPQLRDKLGTRTYYDMKRNDGTVRGSLRMVKTPIQAAHWFIEPGADTTIAHNIAEFIQKCLFDDLNVGWSQVLDDILLMFDYGYMLFEKVYKFENDNLATGKVILRKLAPRHPLDINEWIFDANGGPSGVVMDPFVPYGNQYGAARSDSQLESIGMSLGEFIPINKLVIFSLEPEGGDLRGISILRSAYKHWYYKDTLYKIDAIQKERHGIGVPVIKLPPGYSDDDKKLADELGRNLRTNDRAHIVIPANWEILFAKLEGQPVSAIESIDHHNEQIQVNVLAPFMNSPTPSETSLDMFFKSDRYVANAVAEVINKFVIKQLVDLNFKNGPYPKLRARRIGEWLDLRTLSFAIRNFVGAGLITPDDVLEAQLREESDLPHQDFATSRTAVQPGGIPTSSTGGTGSDVVTGTGTGDANKPLPPKPPKVGLPRQKGTPPVAPPRGNAGRDKSGGK
jgi:hypothetical protein